MFVCSNVTNVKFTLRVRKDMKVMWQTDMHPDLLGQMEN